MNKIKTLVFVCLSASPSLVLAKEPKNFGELVGIFLGLIEQLIPVIMAFVVLIFMWGLVQYMRTEGKERDEGKRFIVWGLITLVVMISIWGLVGIVKGTVFGNNPEGKVPSYSLPPVYAI